MSSTLIQSIARDRIEPDPDQPRKVFGEEMLKEMAQTMIEALSRRPPANPIRTPLRVYAIDSKDAKAAVRYRLIDGERRWRAAHLAGVAELPCVVEKITATDLRTEQLVSNKHVQLSPLEQARAWRQILDKKVISIEALARREGKELSSIYDWLKLCDLPAGIEFALERERIGVQTALLLHRKVPADDWVAVLSDVEGMSFRKVKEYVERKYSAQEYSRDGSERSDANQSRQEAKERTETVLPAAAAPRAKAVAVAKASAAAVDLRAVHREAEEAKAECYFVVQRDGMGTFNSPKGGWTNSVENAKRYATADEARGNSWMAGEGHSVIKVYPTGQRQRIFPALSDEPVKPEMPSEAIGIGKPARPEDGPTERYQAETVTHAHKLLKEIEHTIVLLDQLIASASPEERSAAMEGKESTTKGAKGKVTVCVSHRLVKPVKPNAHSVFTNPEIHSISAPGQGEIRLQIQLGCSGSDRWFAGHHFFIPGTGEGCGASSAAPSANRTCYASREEALAAGFHHLLETVRGWIARGPLKKRLVRLVQDIKAADLYPAVVNARQEPRSTVSKKERPKWSSPEARERLAAAAKARWKAAHVGGQMGLKGVWGGEVRP